MYCICVCMYVRSYVCISWRHTFNCPQKRNQVVPRFPSPDMTQQQSCTDCTDRRLVSEPRERRTNGIQILKVCPIFCFACMHEFWSAKRTVRLCSNKNPIIAPYWTPRNRERNNLNMVTSTSKNTANNVRTGFIYLAQTWEKWHNFRIHCR